LTYKNKYCKNKLAKLHVLSPVLCGGINIMPVEPVEARFCTTPGCGTRLGPFIMIDGIRNCDKCGSVYKGYKSGVTRQELEAIRENGGEQFVPGSDDK